MKYRKSLLNKWQTKIDQDIELEKETRKAVKTRTGDYRKWFSRERNITILAEGDSWFSYPLPLLRPVRKSGVSPGLAAG